MSTLNNFSLASVYRDANENRLTSSFLSLLRLSPTSQRQFYEQVYYQLSSTDQAKIYTPSSAMAKGLSFDTQSGAIPSVGALVSILITNEGLNTNHSVGISDRRAIYDGIIIVGDEQSGSCGFIIENKPSVEDVWLGQLDPGKNSQLHNDVDIIECPVILVWKEIIKNMVMLSKSSDCTFTERLIISDFIDYVLTNHPNLHPYDSFEMCKGNRNLLESHLIDILKNIYGADNVVYHPGWMWTVKTGRYELPEIGFQIVERNGEVGIQTHAVYCTSLAKTHAFFNNPYASYTPVTGAEEWCGIRLGHIMGKYVADFESEMTLSDFITFFNGNRSSIKRVDATQLPSELQILSNASVIPNTTFNQSSIKNILKGRKFVVLTPQMGITSWMPISEVLENEIKGKHDTEQALKRLINIGLTAMSLPPISEIQI